MAASDPIVVVTDTSVLVNFLCIDRMDLIARHSHRFVITDHYAAQKARLAAQRYLFPPSSISNNDPLFGAMFRIFSQNSSAVRCRAAKANQYNGCFFDPEINSAASAVSIPIPLSIVRQCSKIFPRICTSERPRSPTAFRQPGANRSNGESVRFT
jgi:hypothetical protein